MIKLTASELEGVQSQISKMSSKASDCANKVSSVRNGLDMEITAKRNIEERLDNIKRDLTKHSEVLKLYANILNDVINEFVRTDSSDSILQSATSITDWNEWCNCWRCNWRCNCWWYRNSSPSSFNDEYGVTERTYTMEESNYNAKSRSKKRLVQTLQKPGVSPLVYSRFLIDCAVFLSLNDMGKHLPDYEEIPVELDLKPEIKKEYDKIENAFRTIMNQRNSISRKLMSSFLSLMTIYPDQPYNAEPIYYPKSNTAVVEPKDLSNIDELHEKDIATLDIVERKVKNGEKVLIYTSWVKIDTQEKLKKLLENKGYRVSVLGQHVSPDKREKWVENKIKDGLDVLITNPSLVETGLDLNAFTTLIYYNIGYNLFTFRQSSRRSWRINQTAPRIEVYILYYKGVMQARAIKLMASKLAAATLVEGNFSDEGLAAMSDCADMTSQLARELTKGIRDEVEDVAAMFKKMAIVKEDAESEGNIISISDKIEHAKMLAMRLRKENEKNKVKENKYDFADTQMTLFDLFDKAS